MKQIISKSSHCKRTLQHKGCCYIKKYVVWPRHHAYIYCLQLNNLIFSLEQQPVNVYWLLFVLHLFNAHKQHFRSICTPSKFVVCNIQGCHYSWHQLNNINGTNFTTSYLNFENDVSSVMLDAVVFNIEILMKRRRADKLKRIQSIGK